MNKDNAYWVGIDLHQSALMLAAYRGWEKAPEVTVTLDPQGPALRKLLGKLQAKAPVHAVYEASGCGYVLARKMQRWGVNCQVVAPSLIPKKPGDRVKTDKRDADKLATLHRADMLSFVRVPSVEHERLRRIVRTREMVRRDVHRSKQRILKLIQGLGHRRDGTPKKNWTVAHWDWMRALDLHPDEREAWLILTSELETQLVILASVDASITERSKSGPGAKIVGRLRCLRGIDTLSAMVLLTEVCDMSRFGSASAFVGWLGLGVSEHTSMTRRQGGITKTGNGRCRRILIESAWNNRRWPHVSKILLARSTGQSPEIIAHAFRAQKRLHKTWKRLEPRIGSKKAIVALARELAGFVWALWLDKPELLTSRN